MTDIRSDKRTIKSAIAWVFDRWWLLALILVIIQVALTYGMLYSAAGMPMELEPTSRTLYYIGSWTICFLYPVMLIVFIVAGVRFFLRKQKKKAVLILIGLVLSIMLACAFSGYSAFMSIVFNVVYGDGYAEGLVIPDDIDFELPLGEGNGFDPPADSEEPDQQTLYLYNGLQPGIYWAQIWVNPGEAGRIYLKAYEVTQETPLSARYIKQDTITEAQWSDNPDELFLSVREFKIYEGDWGQPYGARFEVWFSPEQGQDRILLQEFYIIEGWMH